MAGAKREWRRGAALAVVAALAVASCTSSDGGAAEETTTTAATTSTGGDVATTTTRSGGGDTGDVSVIDVDEPIDDFYVVPDPLPPGEPGDLIKVQPVDGAPAGHQTYRVMYHSRDARDRDRAVTSVITVPTVEAPKGGWPVVATAHGTSGIASPCALSRVWKTAPSWGVEDAVWAATDYIGLGPVGEVHPYLSRPSEGHSVIDSVRASQRLAELTDVVPAGYQASDQWLSVGHSQGGHGAMSAHELAAEYAPELELEGTLALAPAAMFKKRYGGIDDTVTQVVELMALYGAVDEHPEIVPEDYVSEEGLAKADLLQTACLDEITLEFAGMAIRKGLYDKDPRDTEPAATLIEENDVGKVAVDGVPLFLVSGTKDDRVVIQRARDLFDRLCDSGQETQLLIVDGADHGSILPQTEEETAAWLHDRLDDEPSTNSCEDAATEG